MFGRAVVVDQNKNDPHNTNPTFKNVFVDRPETSKKWIRNEHDMVRNGKTNSVHVRPFQSNVRLAWVEHTQVVSAPTRSSSSSVWLVSSSLLYGCRWPQINCWRDTHPTYKRSPEGDFETSTRWLRHEYEMVRNGKSDIGLCQTTSHTFQKMWVETNQLNHSSIVIVVVLCVLLFSSSSS